MNKLSRKELMESLSETYASNYQYYPESFMDDSFLTGYYPGTFLSESVLNRLEEIDKPICHLGDYWPTDRI